MTFTSYASGATAPVKIYMQDSYEAEVKIKKYEKVYTDALNTNLDLRQALTKVQGNTHPFKNIEPLAPFVPNFQLAFTDLNSQIQSRLAELEQSTSALMTENDDLRTTIEKAKRIAEQTQRMLNNAYIQPQAQPIQHNRYFEPISVSYTSSTIQIKSSLAEKIAAATILGFLAATGNGFASIVGGAASYYLARGFLR